jgi:hypothetical protein
MKLLLAAAITIVALLSLGVLWVMCWHDKAISPPSSILSPAGNVPGIHLNYSHPFNGSKDDKGFTLAGPTPMDLSKQCPGQPLQPGVYQTYPWTIILAVPKRGIDEGIFGNPPSTNSQMPVINPHVEAVPSS